MERLSSAPMPGREPPPAVERKGSDGFAVSHNPAVSSTFAESSVMSLFRGDAGPMILLSEIQKQKEALKTLQGSDQLHAAGANLAQLERAGQAVEILDKMPGRGFLRRPDIARLVPEARKLLLTGDRKKGFELFQLLAEYEVLEMSRSGYHQAAAARYPDDDRFRFVLDFSDVRPASLGPYDPDLGRVKNSGLIRTYERLKASDKEADRLAAEAVAKLFTHFRDEAWLPDATATIGTLKSKVDELKSLLKNPALPVFFAKVQESERKENEKNEGFQARMELAESASAVRFFPNLLNGFETQSREHLKDVTPAMLRDTWKYLLKTAEGQRKYLEEQSRHFEGMNWNGDRWSNKTGLERETCRKDQEAINGVIARLNALEVETDKNRSFGGLHAIARELFPLEEKRLRGLTSRMLDQIGRLPSDNHTIDELKSELGRLTEESHPKIEDRIDACLKIVAKAENITLLRTIDARIRMYEAAKKGVERGHVLDGALTHIVLPLASYEEGFAVTDGGPKTGDFSQTIAKYRELRELAASGDPEKVRAAAQGFRSLEMAGVHHKLQDQCDAAERTFMVVGIGILAASCLVGAFAGAAVAPLVEGSAWAGTAVLAANTAGFTLTSQLLQTIAFDPEFFTDPSLGKLGKKAGEAGAELAMNLLVFAAIGKSVKYFDRLFPAEAVAGSRTLKVLRLAGGFAWEMGTFLPLGFLQTYAHGLLQGAEDPLGQAVRQTFSGKSLVTNAVFLLALKGQNVLNMKIVGPVHDSVRGFVLGKKFETANAELTAEISRLDLVVREAAKNKDPNLGEIVSQYEEALLKQKSLIQSLPENLRHPNVEAKNAEMLGDLAAAKRGLVPFVPIFGAGNRFGIRNAGDFHTYKASEKAGLIGAFRKIPAVDSLKASPNGFIEVRMGGDVTMRFFPETSVPAPRPMLAAAVH